MEIAAQVFGILAFIVSVVSFQLKTYRQILWAQTLCALLFVVHFFLLTRSGQPDEKKRTDKLTTILAVIFSAAVVAIGVATWSSWVSVLFIVAMVLNTVALSIPNPNTVRLFIMMSAPFACAYDILTHSIGGTVNETVSFLSALTAFIRCRRQEKKE